jgi:hypothetical protein
MGPLIYAYILLLPLASGLIGYDCGGHGLNITTFSLLDVGDCELAEVHTITEEAYVQLLQLSDYDRTKIQQCKVEIDRTIFYCGMHSHISAVQRSQNILTHPVEFWLPTIARDKNTFLRRQRDHFRSRTEQYHDQ